MINEWKPPPEKEDSRWAQAHKGGLTRYVLLDALSHKDEQLQTVSKVMESWEGEGVIGDRLLLSDLHAYVIKLKREKSPLTGPPHACKKTAPPPFAIFSPPSPQPASSKTAFRRSNACYMMPSSSTPPHPSPSESWFSSKTKRGSNSRTRLPRYR